MIDTRSRSAAWWIVLAIVCTLLGWWAFRGYLTPGALIDFANMKLCLREAKA
jgi:hypothetical protein